MGGEGIGVVVPIPNEIDKLINNGLTIRKLTPRKCFRLMGLKDKDINLIMEKQSQASCYHLAGDSIVTTVLMAIFSKFYDIDWLDYFNPKEWWQTN